MLCVYTSIHLNIAADSHIATVYKFYWVLIALFAPEFVFFAAFNQWQEARALRKELRAIVPKSDDGMEDAATKSEEQIEERKYLELLKPTLPSPVGKADWSKVSMTSAFFVIMGGLAYRRGYDFDIPGSDYKFPYISLTAQGFLELAKEGVLHPGILDDKAIADRSKADWLAKLLVCAQALWMVFNVIGRKASGLPSTLIELNVIVHVVVMVVVYGLWWNKPLAVQNPVILNPLPEYNDGHTQMLSVLMSSRKWDSQVSKLCYKIVTLHEDDFPLTMILWTSGEDYLDDDDSTRRCMFEYKHPLLSWFRTAVTDVSMNGENCTKGLQLEPGEVLLLAKKLTDDDRYAVVTRYQRPVFLTEHQMHVIENLMVEFKEYPSQTGRCSWGVPEARNIQQECSVSDWRRKIEDKIWLPSSVFAIGATILSLIYAGCHAAAWNSHFPSFTERYLWRGACIVIAAGVPASLLWHRINHVLFSFETFVDNHKFYHRLCRSILQYLHFSMLLTNLLFLPAIILLYTSARIFIVVEAFISMRSLPVGAYNSVDWIEIIPHA
ncbi:hypothetical protein BZA77DRAFT_258231 [Pyronema omphalodes]|nr:hypothetical protein BZA77DRAFT_258231 [Pyronema omphalodes]